MESRTPLSDLVKMFVPRTWKTNLAQADLSGPTYHILHVDNSSMEYEHLTRPLRNSGLIIMWAKRIQNIPMFGRYILRRQQLIASNAPPPTESIRYVCINKKDEETVACYNLDYRRLSLRPSAFDMHTTPAEAHNANIFINPVMLVARVSRIGNKTEFESEIYPEYIVNYLH